MWADRPHYSLTVSMYICKSFHPPPTRTMTFLVAVLPGRASVVKRQVTTFRLSELENAYCACCSSPSFGNWLFLSGGSTRSTRRVWATLLTMAATSASRGSRGLPGTYTCVGAPSPRAPAALARDRLRLGGRTPRLLGARILEGVAGAPSRKLDGGSLIVLPPRGLKAPPADVATLPVGLIARAK